MTALLPAQDRWAPYMRWNAAVAAIVYGPNAAGMPVYLDLEDDVLRSVAEQAGSSVGDPRDELCSAVRVTLNRPDHSAGIFGGHHARIVGWRVESGDPPPDLALLAVLSLAAEDMREGDGFKANNYYDRLLPLLGIDGGEADRDRVVRAYRRCSQELWECLNGWLTDMEGERGLPTAYALSHAHIGRPLSQALIRATDREKLSEFFAELGLPPRSRLSPHDMAGLLAEWIGRSPSPASHTLQALWRRSGARDRITEGACQILETWDGRSGELVVGQDRAPRFGRIGQLRLLVLLRTFPSPALEVNVTGPVLGPDEQSQELLALVDPTTQEAVSDELATEQLPECRWRLSDPQLIDAGSLLEGQLRLRSGTGQVMGRRPRQLIPFARDDLLQAFVELERLPLGEEGLLLCQTGLVPTLERALELVARPGYKLWRSDLPGLPASWVLSSAVQILTPLPEVDPATGKGWPDELNVLQPIATSQIVVGGGLQLPGRLRRWSSLAPPELLATGYPAGDAVHVEVTALRSADTTGAADRTIESPVAVLALAEFELPDGDYEIAVRAAGRKEADQIRLRLRSADFVSRLPRPELPLVRDLDNSPAAVLSASRPESSALQIQGPVVATTRSRLSDLLVPTVDPGLPAWWSRRREHPRHDEEDGRSRRLLVPGAEVGDCFLTGAHAIVLPTVCRGTPATVTGVCRQCGLVKRYPARYHSPQQRHRGGTPSKVAAPRIDLSTIPPVSSKDVDPNVAFDALCHDVGGTASSFEKVALQVEPSGLFSDRFLRGLEGLGHIEVKRSPSASSPEEWEITPSSLAETVGSQFVLVGHRSRRLVSALAKAVEQAGGTMEHRSLAAAPDRLRISGCEVSVVREIAKVAEETCGMPVLVAPQAAWRAAQVLPRLSQVVATLERRAMISFRSARRWDAETCRWHSVPDASLPGAYQLRAETMVYCLRDKDDVASGTMRRADARLVKHAAALDSKEPVLGHDVDTETLYLPLGAELPGLFGRTAILASGLLPVDDVEQRLVYYPSIPRELAGHLASLLQS